jgi:hypothetical protein
MFCQACGMTLTQQMRYCNRCGAQLVASTEEAKVTREKRLDDYLDGLFWITIFGLAFVFGGTVLLKKLELSNWLIFGYMALSSVAFLVNFGLSIWGVVRITREGRREEMLASIPNTADLPPATAAPLPPISSVTENTTRSFEPVYVKRKPD